MKYELWSTASFRMRRALVLSLSFALIPLYLRFKYLPLLIFAVQLCIAHNFDKVDDAVDSDDAISHKAAASAVFELNWSKIAFLASCAGSLIFAFEQPDILGWGELLGDPTLLSYLLILPCMSFAVLVIELKAITRLTASLRSSRIRPFAPSVLALLLGALLCCAAYILLLHGQITLGVCDVAASIYALIIVLVITKQLRSLDSIAVDG